jgi:chromatin segregation and condensation protein Rec8/ScpA/Scc1 (kleisin family)
MLYQQAKLVAKELRPRYDEYSGRYVKGTDDVPPEKGLPLNLNADMLVKALESVLKRIKVAEAQRKPTDLVNPLIKHKVISVEEKIDQMCIMLEEHEEASLFFLLKDSESRAELVARFMGILELIKLRRVLITTITVTEDVVEYNEKGLEMKFKLNPDYIPPETNESEFDTLPDSTTETEKEEDK